ncbi:MAG: hypothetical protein LBD89_05055, partial [Tannerellaceae bacterium]|nr:hypothetical protein [Tannerellaceae bacterium]
MKRFCLFLILLATACFHPVSLFASDNAYTLGGATPPTNQLQIVISSGGYYMVNRNISGTSWSKQFFSTASLFTIKIGTSSFQSTALTIEDISAVTTGTQQHVTKKFSGTYNSSAFSVTLTLTYNTSSPEYFVKQAVLDMSNIPSGTSIIFAYGWDTYVNLSDAGYAYILPDFLGYNNSSSVVNYYMTTAQVQSLRMVGAKNNTGNGALIGFFAMGRNFDRAYSANPYRPGYSYNVVNHTPGSGSTTGTDSNYKFQFGPFSSGLDNGTGVGYDNITPGQITTITTGLTFTEDLEGELDYTWNGSKNYTAALGANINLNLTYKSYNNATLSGIAFRVNFPGLPIRTTGSYSGISGTHTWTVGNEYYQLANGSIAALGTGTITVPVNVTQAGQWIVNANSVTNTVHTLPLGSQATLTVTTNVSLSSNTAVNTCAGTSQTFTVKYPSSQTAAQDVTVNLSYSGATGDFSTRPATVVIPAGSNSANFTVTAAASPTGSSNMVITLSSTDKAFATIGTPASVNIRAYAALTAGAIGTAQTICYNNSPTGLTQTTAPTGGTGTYTYQWQSSTDNSTWSNITTNAPSPTYAPGALTTTTYFRRNVTSGSCGTVSSSSVLITVHPLVTVTAITNRIGCINTAIAGVTFASPTNGVTFTWTNSNTAIGLAASGTGNQPQFTATQTGTATITVTPYYSGCAGTPTTYTLTIYPCSIPVNPHLRSSVV